MHWIGSPRVGLVQSPDRFFYSETKPNQPPAGWSHVRYQTRPVTPGDSSRGANAFDLVMQRQEPLPGQIEAVVGLQLFVNDVDQDLLLEIEQLENG
jgi:hypothetical protein